MAIITISRQMGSAGTTLGAALARRLGYAVVDKELILRVAQGLNVSQDSIARYDQEEFSRGRAVVEQAFAVTPAAYPSFVMGAPYSLAELSFPVAALAALDGDNYLAATQQLIKDLATRGNVVLMGRGAQLVLAGHPDVLHVRTVAPLAERVRRVSEWFGLAAADARALVERRDKACANYLDHFYHRDWADPELYDLTINTGRLPIPAAAAIIVKHLENQLSS